MPDRLCCEQEVLDIVRGSLERFDAVCLATALHRMAALEAAPERAALAVERPEFARLTASIGARPAIAEMQFPPSFLPGSGRLSSSTFQHITTFKTNPGLFSIRGLCAAPWGCNLAMGSTA